MSCVVDESTIQRLAVRYMGIGPALDRDETEILLFALYCESDRNGGIISKATVEAERIAAGKPKPPKPAPNWGEFLPKFHEKLDARDQRKAWKS